MTGLETISFRDPPLKVSIAMATFNGGAFILEQLESLAHQSVTPYELIISDDGSTDRTLEIVNEFATKSPFPVRIYRNEVRLGFANNFLRAASLCDGDVISFCDQDDKWRDTKLEVCLSEFADQDVLLCVHGARLWDGGAETGRLWPHFNARKVWQANSLDPLNVYPGFTMLFRRQLLQIFDNSDRPGDIHSLSDTRAMMPHDKWIWFLASIFGKIVFRPETLALYRQHGQNACGSAEKGSYFDRISRSVRNISYRRMSELSTDCAEFLENFSINLSDDFKFKAIISAAGFRRRAIYYAQRHHIYDEGGGWLGRTLSFLRLLFSGAYFPNSSHTSLGPKAAVKDFLFGVPGIHKFRI